jgi:hypothetical protein
MLFWFICRAWAVSARRFQPLVFAPVSRGFSSLWWWESKDTAPHTPVFWLNVSSKPALLTSLRRLGRVILPEPGDQLQDDMMLTQVSVWLSNLENSRWLLVFDNYDDPDQFNNIREYFPSVAQGSIIITTRRPNLVNGIKINVGSIAEKGESLRILATRSRRENVESSEKTSQRSVHA